jgi:hypothetical protein
MDRKKVFWTVVIAIILFIGFLVVAALAPESYSSTREELFIDRPEEVWENLTSVDVIPRRKREVQRVEIVYQDRGKISWREFLKNGEMRMLSIINRDHLRYVEIQQFQSSYGVTGTWTYTLEKIDDKTLLTVTEDSLNTNMWLRGWYTIRGRDVLLKREIKSLRVSLFQRLLTTE